MDFNCDDSNPFPRIDFAYDDSNSSLPPQCSGMSDSTQIHLSTDLMERSLPGISDGIQQDQNRTTPLSNGQHVTTNRTEAVPYAETTSERSERQSPGNAQEHALIELPKGSADIACKSGYS